MSHLGYKRCPRQQNENQGTDILQSTKGKRDYHDFQSTGECQVGVEGKLRTLTLTYMVLNIRFNLKELCDERVDLSGTRGQPVGS